MSTKSTISSPKDQQASQQLRARFGSQVEQHANLAAITGRRFGSIADFLLIVETIPDLVDAVTIAYATQLPYRVVGATTGLLFSDVGFPGLVIVNRCRGVMVDEANRVTAQAGLANSELVNWAATRGLGGLDYLAAIPGTIGGATVSRAQYQDKQIVSYVRNLSVFWPAAPVDSDHIIHLPIDTLAWRLVATAASDSNPYPPVIVSVTLQAALVHQDTLVRRLQAIRRQRFPLKERAVGYIFSEPIDPLMFDRGQLRRVPSLVFDRDDRNILYYHQRLNSARALRQQLEAWRQIINEQRSDPLDYRLNFLGYWPDEEGDQTVNR